MSLAHWQKTFTDTSGNVRAGLSVEIRDESTGAIAAIYEDVEGATPKSNPLTTDEFGYANFYAADGRYRIQATGVDWRNEAVLTAANVIAAQVAAEEAAKAAEGSANTYPTTAAGIAGTSSGKYFTVPSSKTTGYLDLYLNNSGAAQLSRTSASDQVVSQAETARDMAQASANFKGKWADLTGSGSIPTSVLHDGKYWMLVEELADITTAEPGASSAWSHIYMGESLPFGPGPQQLIAGDMTAGFFGEVSAGELFSGDELAFITGVTEGVAQNSDAGWLKFAHNNKIKYIAKKPIRHTINWDHLYSRGLVYGIDGDGKYPRGTPTNQLVTVAKAGAEFAVRLVTGAGADPFPESDPLFFTDDMHQMNVGAGSEWNELIYRVHSAIPSDPTTDGMVADRHGGPQAGANWASYTNGDLSIGTGNGRASWCQETSDTTSSVRVHRGYVDLASFDRNTASFANSNLGWRPCIQLITNP